MRGYYVCDICVGLRLRFRSQHQTSGHTCQLCHTVMQPLDQDLSEAAETLDLLGQLSRAAQLDLARTHLDRRRA